MIIEIEPTSPTPIYLQVMFQIKKAIVQGYVSAGDSLPSVRSLASELGINMHTINKAYNLLTDDGILVKSQKGYFIQDKFQRTLSEEVRNEMKGRLETLIVDAYIHQLSEDEIEAWTKKIMEDLKKGEKADVDF